MIIRCKRWIYRGNSNISFIVIILYIILFRINRFDRIPYLLERWRGVIILSVFLKEEEMKDIDYYINRYGNSRITFVLYIAKFDEINNVYGYYIDYSSRKIQYQNPIYPLNLMRDLAIESIRTSHYLLIDIDFFISSSLYSNLLSSKSILQKEETIILLNTFVTNKEKLFTCQKERSCEKL